MTRYHVRLEHPVATSFRAQRAADSLDIDTKKKSVHEFSVDADLDTPYNVGLILGASGSGKTTLIRSIFGDDCFGVDPDVSKPIIEQFPADWTYDQCASALAGVGLTAVPCWIRPVYTLSNGQQARAKAALLMAHDTTSAPAVVDEWTSVVDRTVGKVMSHCIQKHARRTNSRIILASCHYDVMEWLNPDWVIDCNRQTYLDRRSLQQGFERSERLDFEIREVDRSTWRFFSRYHYLTEKLPGGFITTYGVFHGDDQIGFQCFANYVPHKQSQRNTPMIMHSNRTVIHPDYAGLGLGIKVINATSAHMHAKGFRVMAKFSSTPIYRAMIKQPCWRHMETKRLIGHAQVGKIGRGTSTRYGSLGKVGSDGAVAQKSSNGGFRENVKTFSFEYIGDHTVSRADRLPEVREAL